MATNLIGSAIVKLKKKQGNSPLAHSCLDSVSVQKRKILFSFGHAGKRFHVTCPWELRIERVDLLCAGVARRSLLRALRPQSTAPYRLCREWPKFFASRGFLVVRGVLLMVPNHARITRNRYHVRPMGNVSFRGV